LEMFHSMTNSPSLNTPSDNIVPSKAY